MAIATDRRRKRLPPEIFDLPVEKMREGYYTDVYFNHARETLLAGRAAPARGHAGLPEAARRAGRDGRGDRDPQALLRRLGRADRPRALRRRRDRAVGDGDDDRGRLHALRAPGDLLPRRARAPDADLHERRAGSSRRRAASRSSSSRPGTTTTACRPGDGYAAHVAGAIGVSTDAQASWWGGRGIGTVPHALIAAYGGNTVLAATKFAESAHRRTSTSSSSWTSRTTPCAPRSRSRARWASRLWGVRLDTSRTLVDRSLWSEMGDFDPRGVNERLVRKVRDALDENGFERVKIVVSGGFDVERIREFEAKACRSTPTASARRSSAATTTSPADIVLTDGQPVRQGRPQLPPEPAARARRLATGPSGFPAPCRWNRRVDRFADFINDLPDIALTWLPLIFLGLIVYLIWKSLSLMPRVRPTEVEPSSKSSVTWDDIAGVDEAAAELQEVVDFLQDPAPLLQARRARAEGHPALRPARHRQDAAREGGRPRLGLDLLLAERLRLRGDVRRPRRRPHPQALRPRAQERARDRLHRRARRRRHAAHRLRLQPRARPDAEPAPRRARRLRPPATQVVIIAASNRLEDLDPALLRPGRFDRQVLVGDARPRRARGDPRRAHAREAARGRRRPRPRSRARPPGSPAPTWPTSATRRAIFAGRAGAGRDLATTTSTPPSSGSSPASSSAESSPRRRSASSPTTRAATRSCPTSSASRSPCRR